MMIDIHSHILPEIDDGAKDIEETRRMLEISHKEGIRKIIATPHFNLRKKYSLEILEEKHKIVQQMAKEIDKEFEIYLGNEIFFEDGILEAIEERKVCTMAGSRYVLIEFSIGERYQAIYNGMKDIILGGFVPIIAHVERYDCLWKKRERMEELVELGCYIQLNTRSLIGGILNNQAAYCRKLVKSGLVHFIASDSHNIGSRKPLMDTSLIGLRKTLTEVQIQNLVKNHPNKVIENNYI